jgi:tRNA 5-methylaminomethyl-2-thiouridine biosynthesis bifunctional protein
VPGASALPSDAAAHLQNLARLERLRVAAPAPTGVAGMFDAVRCVARDRLPLAGRFACVDRDLAPAVRQRGAHLADLPRRPGAFGLLALGSRGLTLAPLLGELVAAQINGEPWPVEKDLAAAVDPARFQLRRFRR